MATTIAYGDALNEQSWRSGITLATQLQTYSATFEEVVDANTETVTPKGAIVVVERGGKRGTTHTLRFQGVDYEALPKTRLAQVLGQEAGSQVYEHSVVVRYFSFDGAIENVPDDQNKVSWSLNAGEINRITREAAVWADRAWIYHGCGYTPANDLSTSENNASAGNAVVAQDSNHHIYVDGSTTNSTAANVAADTNAVLTSRVLSDAVDQITSREYVKWPAAKCKTPWGDYFVCLAGPQGFSQIRKNSSTSDVYDLHRADIEGGGSFLMNPLLTGEGFIAGNSCLVLKSDFMPKGFGGSSPVNNTRMAMLFGAGAFTKMYGEGYTDGNHWGWSEHKQHRRISMLSDTICGLNRTIVDGESWACLALTHYSAKA